MGVIADIIAGPPRSRRARIEPRFMAASVEDPSVDLSNPSPWLLDALSGSVRGEWGPPVSERTAMAVSAVYRSVTLIAGLVAELPLKIYRRTPDGREEVPDHWLAPLLQQAPFPGRAMTAFTWRELWLVNVLLSGNHYSAIRRDGAGRVIGFESALPLGSDVLRNNYRNVYRLELMSGTIGYGGASATTWEYLDQDDVLHIPGPGFDGRKGVSRIQSFARKAVSLASLLEDQIGFVHENAAKPSGLVTPGKRLAKDGWQRWKAQFTEANTGRHNAGRLIFGDDGATYTPMQMTPEDLNTIEARRYQVADVSRFFGVPLHLLNETDKSTSWGSGLSEQTLGFLIYTLNPDLGRIESEINYKLLDGSGYYAEFDRDAMMAMDPVKAAQVAQTEVASGVLLINERRRQKNRPPVDHGNDALINSTNVPLAKLYEPGAQPRQDPIQADPLGPKPDVGAPSPGDGTAAAAGDATTQEEDDAQA